jgi:hypothetical protein
MGILDDAIKEHLELKRQHGADEPELKQLEDEVFGATERPGSKGAAPDPLAEAPTEFMTQPEIEEPAGADSEGDAAAGRRARPDIADLQEAPELEPEAPAEEPAPAMEHEAIPEPQVEPDPNPESSPSHSTEERHAIAEQPTELFDVEEELSGEVPAPSEEELAEEEMSEPRLAPVEPFSAIDEAEETAEAEADDSEHEIDDFFDEKRLSDELDQALEAPSEEAEPALEEEAEEEHAPEEEPEPEEPPRARPDEDVLEETPDFLEEAPEDDRLWFEQKPPKDFDFDD